MIRFSLCLFAASLVPAAAEVSFEYDRTIPLDLQETGVRTEGDATLRDVSYVALDGKRNAATIVSGKAARPRHSFRALV